MVIEFYHDVLCAWCYALSPRLRKIVKEYPDIEVIHKAFPLAPEHRDLSEMFGNKDKAKEEILNHWRAANANDDEHRINAGLMAMRDFDYPYSMPGLMSCKAAELQGGQEAHWNYFDRVQKAHLTDCENIADQNVLINCAETIGLDIDRFIEDFQSEKARNMVMEDYDYARKSGVTATPTLIIDRKWIISGAVKYEELKQAIEEIITGKLE